MKKSKQQKGNPGVEATIDTEQPATTAHATVAESVRAETPAPTAGSAEPPQPSAGDGDGASAEPAVKSDQPESIVQFPIVGIGASAGGLAALESLFAHMPQENDTGIAFVIVQHLHPDHKSILSELIQRYTRMRVMEAVDGIEVKPNCTYIIQPNKDLALIQGKLHLINPSPRREHRLPIDFFFRSLAQDRNAQAIGIILSGNGTDGTLGVRAIKEAGGMVAVQDPLSAEYDGMPRSAIASGLADYVLPPDEIPAQVIAHVKRTSRFRPITAEAPAAEISGWILKIMALLRTHSGHDFSQYKQNTIRRRVERRMAVNQVDTLDHYVRLLRQNPAELSTLFRELLIGVTSFFRDPPAFDCVRDSALSIVMGERAPGLPIRIWVPGCSTGEEAYSIAMLVDEESEKLGRDFVVQVFATDIDHESIEKARLGIYPANIAADVSPERLERFFTHEDKDFYRVKKTLRDQLVFAEQDINKDPPFSKLDLVSCRNMLIYMEPVLQRRLLPLFHYALAPGGFLLLGNSESIGEFNNLFAVVDRKWKLYRRKDLPVPAPGTISIAHHLTGEHTQRAHAEAKDAKTTLREVTERVLLRNYAPACVAVNEQGEILYVHGRSGKYLELPSGEASLNLVRAAREGLKIELASALRRVLSDRQTVRFERLQVRTNGGFQAVNVTVEIAEGLGAPANLILVTFQEAPPKASGESAAAPKADHPPAPSGPPDEKDRYITNLERELRVKSETLQTTIEELETSNEELKSTNEELQSTNEELETSKEELQSVNEELLTVNTELQQKMEGLSRANNDMNNLLAGTGIGMLFVDHQLHIQRFTPAITRIINLIQTDIGRPVSDLVSNLAGSDQLGQDVKAVLDSLIPRETEVQTRDGHWYLMRVLPYRTVENVIEGAVLTFVDIAAQKRAEEQFRKLSAELEQRVHDRVDELERLNQELQLQFRQRQEAEDRRAADIAAMARLNDLAARRGPLQDLLQASLDAALEMTRAQKGTLQLYDESSQTLRLVVHQGLPDPFVTFFANLNAESHTPCAKVLKTRKRVIVPDLSAFAPLQASPELTVLQAAGVRAIQSTPVLGRDRRLLGVVSTHWSEPRQPEAGTLLLLDLLTRQVAGFIENDATEPNSPATVA